MQKCFVFKLFFQFVFLMSKVKLLLLLSVFETTLGNKWLILQQAQKQYLSEETEVILGDLWLFLVTRFSYLHMYLLVFTVPT